ncbi:SigE family RNA polymerase sigma factor [Egibacter rhizosphaerae]|nr:SigE family RNA polymerase sigma factor [Egibacter rhizosphaerae]
MDATTLLPRPTTTSTTVPVLDDTEDFTAIFAAHHDEAVRLAYLICGDQDRAEDAVADAMVKVWRAWQRGRIDNPRAYLRRAVVNQVNSRFRRLALERREAERRVGDDRGPRDPDTQVVDRDEIFEALQQLPSRQRTAIVLRYYEDLPEREAADLMGCSVGTVKSAVSRGLERLRSMVGEEVA